VIGLSLELRRGLGRWLVVPLALVGILYAYQIVPAGPPIWPIMVSALAYSVVLTGPLAAGVAALAGTRSHRRHMELIEQLSTQSSVLAGLAELGALLVWVFLAFNAVLVSLFVPAIFGATWSGPDGLRTLTTALGMLLYVVVGFIIGRLVPSRLTPPVVAIVLFAAAVLLNSNSSTYRWSLLLPVNQGFSDEFSRLNNAAFSGQLVWYVGIGLLLASGWAVHQAGPSRPGIVLVVAGLILTVSGVAIVVPQGGHYLRAGDYAVWTCRGNSPQICLHPALVDTFPDVIENVTPVAARLAGTPFAVRRAEQRPRGLGSRPTPGAVSFALDDTRPGSLALAGRELAVNALGDQDSCFAADATSDGYELAQLVGSWAAGDRSLYTPTTMAAGRARTWFLGIDDAARRRWLTQHEAAVRHCTLQYSAFR